MAEERPGCKTKHTKPGQRCYTASNKRPTEPEPEPGESPEALLGACGLILGGDRAGSAGHPTDTCELPLSLSYIRTPSLLCEQLSQVGARAFIHHSLGQLCPLLYPGYQEQCMDLASAQ